MIYFWILFISILFFLKRDCQNFFTIENKEMELNQFYSDSKQGKNYFFVFLDILITSILVGIRYDVGTDYMTYVHYVFPQITSHVKSYEPLFNVIVRIFEPNFGFPVVFLILAFIFFSFLYLSVLKNSPYFVFSVFISIGLLFLSFSMSGIRQAISMSVFLYSLKYIYKGDLKRYLLFILIACAFHSSAVVYLPIYFLRNIKFDLKYCILLPFFFFLTPTLGPIITMISNRFGFYATYFNNIGNWGGNFGYNVLIFILELLVFLVYCFVGQKVTRNNDPINIGVWIQYLASLILSINSIIPTSTRVMMLFLIGNVVFIPLLIFRLNNLEARIIFFCLFSVILFLIFYWYVMVNNQYDTIPYHIIWKNQIYYPDILN